MALVAKHLGMLRPALRLMVERTPFRPWVLVGLPDDETSLARKKIRDEQFRREGWR